MRPTEFSEDDLRDLMEEPAGGHNAGRSASSDPNGEGRWVPLQTSGAQAEAFLRAGGWTLVDATRGSRGATQGARDAGMHAHRGVLRGDEHIDTDDLRAKFEALFGFTFDEIRSVYRQGRLSKEQGELRARIDTRLLALSRAGGNLLTVARVLGWQIQAARAGADCRTMDRAIARAKAAEA